MVGSRASHLQNLGIVSLLALFASVAIYFVSPVLQAVGANPNDTILKVDGDYARVIKIDANDFIYNSADKMVYLSRPSSNRAEGNGISRINTLTGESLPSVWVGSEPSKLALSADGMKLYVGLNGAYAIRSLSTLTQEPGEQFALGNDGRDPFIASDIEVAPWDPNLVAVARTRLRISPGTSGVAVFKNGIRLPNTTVANLFSSDFIAFSGTSGLLYGGGEYGGLRSMMVDESGVSLLQFSDSPSAGNLKLEGGRIYNPYGQAIDPGTRTVLGAFVNGASAAFAPDAAVGRYYSATTVVSGSVTVRAYDLNTFVPLDERTIPGVNGTPRAMIRYGSNGLAIRTSMGEVVLFQTALIPTNDPLPVPSPTPTLTPTPTPRAFRFSVREVPIQVNDIAGGPQDGKLYLTVPSTGGALGNSVSVLNPDTGMVESSTFIGSEPGQMEFADDGRTIYVTINGAGSVRKFDTVTGTPGKIIRFGFDNYGLISPLDIAVQPGSTDTIAIQPSTSFTRAGVYDGDQPRAQRASNSGPVAFSAASTLLVDSGATIEYSVDAAGLHQQRQIVFGGSGSMIARSGVLYAENGAAADLVTGSGKGSFALPYSMSYAFELDAAKRRAYFLIHDGNYWSIVAYDIDTFLEMGRISLTHNISSSGKMVRWGENGLALKTSTGKILLIQTDLISDNAPLPMPTPTISPTPTPSPAYIPTFFRRVNLRSSGVVYSAPNDALFVTVPSAAGLPYGNTITRLNPHSGVVESSVFIGSEPSAMAATDDGSRIYTKLDGANSALRIYDIATSTAGMSFQPPLPLRSFTTLPGQPNLVAVASNRGFDVLDQGVLIPNNAAPIVGMQVIPIDGRSFYGYDGSLHKITIADGQISRATIGYGLFTASNLVKSGGGLLFSGSGDVANPVENIRLGNLSISNTTFAVESDGSRVYSLSGNVLTAFDVATFKPIGSVVLPVFYGTPRDLVRWGSDGLAFRTDNSSTVTNDGQTYILRTALVNRNARVPTGVQLETSVIQSSEGAGTVSVAIRRTGDISGPTTVGYSTVDGTAIGGTDFTPTGGSLTFLPGELSKTVSIPLINDSAFEQTESFEFSLSPAPGSPAVLTYPTSVEISISDNDSRPNISGISTVVDEPVAGASVTVPVTIRLSNLSFESVSVNYETMGSSAASGIDFVPTSGSLTFQPGESEKIVSVRVYGDTETDEPEESFFVRLSAAVNSTILFQYVPVMIRNFDPRTVPHAKFDFDGDGRADRSVFRPSESVWYSDRSRVGFDAVAFGLADDAIAPADFDGDGRADHVVYRDGVWHLLRSSTGYVSVQFGLADDIPVPEDFDGDGLADIAVWRPSDGIWYVLRSTGGTDIQQFGAVGDRPLAADYDGDAKADRAVYRNGTWYVLGSGAGVSVSQFGLPEDVCVPADYDGDGKSDLAVYRGGIWYVLESANGSVGINQFGLAGDTPVPADYDGDGKTDRAVYRAGQWYALRSRDGVSVDGFGTATDRPVNAAFVRSAVGY